MMARQKQLGFEEALSRLEELVAELEGGDLSLEDSLRAFEQGIRLVRQCSDRLKAADLRISQLEEGGNERPLEAGDTE
jgi:exodeoxyribonuclease VII small subunit